MTLEIVPGRIEHAYGLAPYMRAEDAAEVTALSGFDPLRALVDCFGVSVRVCTLLINGSVAAMWGIEPLSLLGGVGCVWMLTGEAVNRRPLAFLRRCRGELAKLSSDWPVLMNVVDARYTRAIQWARWLGFEIGAPMPIGVDGLPFHPITLRREN